MKIRIAVAAISVAAVMATPALGAGRRNIHIVGSSTVYPFTTAVAERFARANPGIPAPIIESTGTGAGMKLFCAGVGERFPDIEDASRRMKASEAKTCAANGVTKVTEIQVGLDGIVLAGSKNSPALNLSRRDIYLALAANPYGKPNRAKTWKDVNPKLPNVKIQVYGPPPTSGTRDAIGELLMTPPCEANAGMAAMKKANEAKFKAICTGIREDGAYVEAGENDNLIVRKLGVTPGAYGLFGYSYLEENAGTLQGATIDGVAPSYDSIASFKYPGARPLYIYVKNAHAAAIPGIRQFVAEFTKESTWGRGGYLARRGMISSPDNVRAAAARTARELAPVAFASLK
ncbi:MAG TPA: substrate-binding domain-containing protein [Allosphingosinicella sp.]|nr:substrate-binding domain-containing protein [Allosphingosinicella sp.]